MNVSTAASYMILILTSVFCVTCVGALQNNDVITISLVKYNPVNYTQVFTTTALLDSGANLIVNVTDVNPSIQFFIIQAHSFQRNIVLSNNANFVLNSFVNGTNIGLIQKQTSVKNYQFFIKNEFQQFNHSILIAVVPYGAAPVPGGCNMEFMTEIAPYQRLTYTDSVITVDAESASANGQRCEMQGILYETYHMYLPEWDYTVQTYFEGIRSMLSVNDIMIYGSQVYKRVGNNFLRRMYSAYKGTGSIYVVIASYGEHKAAYVPIATYACNALSWEDSCDGPTTTVSRILCGVLFFLGIFTCYFGHKFFKTEMFLVGSLVGGFLSYLALSVIENLSERDALIIAIVLGVIFGFLWLGFWWFCGSPVLSTLLVIMVLGSLFASIVFYLVLGDMIIFHNDITFWGFFLCIVLLTMTIFTSFTQKANILACSVVGSYAFIIPIDHYWGTNLKYILINTIRRATVDNFGSAIIDPPYQYKDILLHVLWMGMALSGVVFQLRQQRGRPPFPPASARTQLPDERTPLLMPTSTTEPLNRIILIHSAPPDS